MGDPNSFYPQKAADVVGPVQGRTGCFAVTTSSVALDLNTLFAAAGGIRNKIVTLKAEGCKVYYVWAADGTGSVDPAATGVAATTAQYLSDGERSDEEQPLDDAGNPLDFIEFRCEAAGSGFLRVHISSKGPGQ